MLVTFFGVRGSCPCSSDLYQRYGGNTSCVLVEVDGEPPVILDMGTGLRTLGSKIQDRERPAGTPPRATVLLSHLHYDHVLGLPFFAPLLRPDAMVDVYGPSQVGSTLGETLAGLIRPPFFPINAAELPGHLQVHDLDGPFELDLGSIRVTAREVPHIGHTLGFRIEAEGRVLAYIPDHQASADLTSIDQQVLDLCDGADLVIHDAQYTEKEFAAVAGWGHSTADYAVRVAIEAGARALSLFHYDPSHGDQEIDAMLEEARRLAADHRDLAVRAAAEGSSIDLGSA